MIKRILNFAKDYYSIKNSPIEYARRIGVKVGISCKFGDISRGTFSTEPYLISIGDHVEITSGVRFITHDGAVWVYRQNEPNLDVFGKITVGNNVFIGMYSLILPGVTVGDNVIIGAGSVVSKDIPSNVVAAGVPAKPIRSVEEYRERIRDKETHIRDWKESDKKEFLSRL